MSYVCLAAAGFVRSGLLHTSAVCSTHGHGLMRLLGGPKRDCLCRRSEGSGVGVITSSMIRGV
jgi:hypothetical protein